MITKIDELLCIGCGVCDVVCPADVIRMSESTGKPVIAYLEDCWTCYACEIDCPVKAIKIHPIRKQKPPMLIALEAVE